MRRLFSALTIMAVCGSAIAQADVLTVSRSEYQQKLHGFWLGQCIANWTGLITEMDKIGGEGDRGILYARELGRSRSIKGFQIWSVTDN